METSSLLTKIEIVISRYLSVSTDVQLLFCFFPKKQIVIWIITSLFVRISVEDVDSPQSIKHHATRILLIQSMSVSSSQYLQQLRQVLIPELLLLFRRLNVKRKQQVSFLAMTDTRGKHPIIAELKRLVQVLSFQHYLFLHYNNFGYSDGR